MRNPIARVVCLLVLAAAVPDGAAAQADRSIELERFHADVRVHENGRVDVVETLDVRFDGSWNGFIREISLQHRTATDRRSRLAVEVAEVTDGAGNPLEYRDRRSGAVRALQIWVPEAEDATRRVVIRYSIANALRFFDDATVREGGHDELYWNVTGTAWEMPIRAASARVVLPDGASGVQAWGYTGGEGSDAQDASVDVRGTEVRVRAARPFSAGEGLTVYVVWEPGAVDRVAAAAAAREGLLVRLARGWPLTVPLLAFLFGFTVWNRNGREPRRRALTVAYEPPPGMTPAEVGTLVDHKAQMHDITSTLVDLAVRGYVVIEEEKRPRFAGLGSRTDYVFHLRPPSDAWQALAPHEERYLLGMFMRGRFRPGDMARFAAEAAGAHGHPPASGETASGAVAAAAPPTDTGFFRSVRLSQLRNRFHAHLPGIRNAIYHALVKAGYYRKRPDRSGEWLVFLAVLVFMLSFFVLIPTLNGELLLDWRLVAGSFATAVATLVGFSRVMTARTEAGVRALEQALGFREFLKKVEQPRYRSMITSPDLFERYLPYAMAFRVESRWARAFEGLYRAPPEWYRGSGGGRFHTAAFARGLHRMSSRTGRAMSASPSSSAGGGSRSGSGGGGRSGGGSGGGGGRGF